MPYSLNLVLRFPIINNIVYPQIFTKTRINSSSFKAHSPDGEVEYFRTYLDELEDSVYECDKYLVAVKDHQVAWFRLKSTVKIRGQEDQKEKENNNEQGSV